jgi:hypothetical protein
MAVNCRKAYNSTRVTASGGSSRFLDRLSLIHMNSLKKRRNSISVNPHFTLFREWLRFYLNNPQFSTTARFLTKSRILPVIDRRQLEIMSREVQSVDKGDSSKSVTVSREDPP